MTDQLAGTGTLLRLALRRDRVMMPVWTLLTTLLVVSMPGALGSVYATAAERARAAASMNANSSMRALYGPVFGDSLGALTAWRGGVYAAVLAAVMSLVVVVRHTREEEESGRQELLSAAMVGRRAPLTSALLAALVADAAVALLVAGGLAGQGVRGALALGLAVAGTGLLFACTAAVAAQLTESARAAKGIAAAVLGAAFVLKAAGDAGTGGGRSALTWASPLGWVENVRAFAAERWWVLLLFVGAVAVQAGAAYVLAGRRDLGMSFLPSRPGPAEGRLGTAGALALRLQRGSVLGWSAGFLVAGVVFGGMADGAADLVGDNDRTREIIERMGGQGGPGVLTDAFLATMAGMFGMVAALYAVSAVLRLSGEESGQRAEPLLANAVGRLRWAGGHLAVAFGGSALILLLAGLGLGLGHGRGLGAAIGATLAQLPAVWLIGALAALLYGAVPQYAAAAWAVAGGVLALGWIGPALNLPQAVLNLSPFAHLPRLPGAQALDWAPPTVLTALAVALTAAGLGALRRRDMIA
ncbi:ABC transporter permease [Streptomyces avidinii]|uniref:ABC-2 type transport system permease protein n=1 Tax=Streptomyces avidinii TaxID=1895 RepID=A0ABS4LCK3_STRAV|nr:ABC transporter permease [Streptomyces avidinii]MBP2039781.1 ABC-2 type transport system permease protein [Streptomyces avidinii]GGZ16778.1 ABC transporter membrane-spanning protein [Streptomyces avidinii]